MDRKRERERVQEKRTNLSCSFGRVRATAVSGAKTSQLSSSKHGQIDSKTAKKTWENSRNKRTTGENSAKQAAAVSPQNRPAGSADLQNKTI